MITTNSEKLHAPEGIPITLVNVMVVEDDADDSILIGEMIREVAPLYAVTSIEKSERVIEHLNTLEGRTLPSLIILDYNMAPLTGLEVLRELKSSERYKSIPVAVYTSSYYPKHKEECVAAGACTYLTKSNTLDEVREDVRRMLSYCL